jgi:membrane protein implicated in regulation of membrane protease activity
MDKIKTILILIAIIIGALAVLGTIGFLYSLLQFVLMVGVLGVAGYIGVRLLSSKSPRQIDSSSPEGQMQKVERTLEEYKRKLK